MFFSSCLTCQNHILHLPWLQQDASLPNEVLNLIYRRVEEGKDLRSSYESTLP